MKQRKSEKEEILERHGIKDYDTTTFPIGDMIGGILTNAVKQVVDPDFSEEPEEDKLRK